MDKEKFSRLAEKMKNLTSDFCFAETKDVKDFTTRLIVTTAMELIAAAGATPKKSEMPCNCQKENIQEKVVKVVVDSVKKNSPPDTKVTVFTVDHC